MKVSPTSRHPFAVVKSMSLRSVVLALACCLPACWNPQVKNLGFACNANDVTPCPSGFQCINGYCDNGSGGPRGNGGGGGSGGGNARVDMTPAATVDMSEPQQANVDMSMMPPADMAQPQSIVDMAQPAPPDMSCRPIGASCTSYKQCCSGHCHSSTTFVCYSG